MIQLKEVIHLYLGCRLESKTGTVILMAVQKEVIPISDFKIAVINGNTTYLTDLGNYRPVLRSLSDMKEDECKTIGLEKIYKEITSKEISGQGFVWKSGEIIHLLKWGFDLFGLIESNQAVNKLTL